jgi:rhodanese-related sulfurtransferase
VPVKALRLSASTFALAIALAQCSPRSSTGPDTGAGDSANLRDAGQPDAADLRDAGQPDAANLRDAGQPDAADLRDAGQPDAAPDGSAGIADKAPRTTDATVTGDLAADMATDLRASMADLVADTSASDAAGAGEPTGTAGGDLGCSGWTTLLRLSPAELADLLATSDPIVINVHIPYAGDIPGTDTSIPYSDVDAIEAYLNYDHCADVVLICLSGGMSQSAGNELVKRGYLRVRDLKGGMEAWQAAGYPLLKDGGT